MSKTIPAGYQVEVTSWENDGDSYKTEIINGLTEQEAKLVVKYCEKFVSKNSYSGKAGLGNSDTSEVRDELDTLFYDLCAEMGVTAAEEDSSLHSEMWYDLIGLWCDGQFVRVFERAEVFFVPEKVEFKEVTFD